MKPFQFTRRALNAGAIAAAALAAIGGCAAAFADQKVVKVGITLPFTGADAEDANLIKNGAMIAIDEANAAGGVAGYKVVPVVYDDGTATAGQYDPAQSATNAKKLISDPAIVAKLNVAINESLRSPEINAAIVKLGSEPRIGSPQEFSALVAADFQRWTTVAKSAAVKMD